MIARTIGSKSWPCVPSAIPTSENALQEADFREIVLAQALVGDAQYENGHVIAGIILLEV